MKWRVQDFRLHTSAGSRAETRRAKERTSEINLKKHSFVFSLRPWSASCFFLHFRYFVVNGT